MLNYYYFQRDRQEFKMFYSDGSVISAYKYLFVGNVIKR